MFCFLNGPLSLHTRLFPLYIYMSHSPHIIFMSGRSLPKFVWCFALVFFLLFHDLRMGRLDDFVGDQSITKFNDFCSSVEEGLSIALACYIGVEEGVDMWFLKNDSIYNPKFRLNIIVGNNEKQATFNLRDGVAAMVAMDTCDVLMPMVGCVNADCVHVDFFIFFIFFFNVVVANMRCGIFFARMLGLQCILMSWMIWLGRSFFSK
jgi:hypothetical protein